MKLVYLVLGLFVGINQISHTYGTDGTKDSPEGTSLTQNKQVSPPPPEPLTIREQVDDVFFDYDEGKPEATCFAALTALEPQLLDDNINDVYLERMEAAILAFHLSKPEFSLNLLKKNITSKSSPFSDRVTSLVLAYFSKAAENDWVVQMLNPLNNYFLEKCPQKDCEIDVASTMSLVMLNCKMGLEEQGEKVWAGRWKLPSDELLDGGWHSFVHETCPDVPVVLNLKNDSNPFVSKTLAFLPHWEVFMETRTIKEINKVAKKRIALNLEAELMLNTLVAIGL
jgi:hypothetical protein